MSACPADTAPAPITGSSQGVVIPRAGRTVRASRQVTNQVDFSVMFLRVHNFAATSYFSSKQVETGSTGPQTHERFFFAVHLQTIREGDSYAALQSEQRALAHGHSGRHGEFTLPTAV